MNEIEDQRNNKSVMSASPVYRPTDVLRKTRHVWSPPGYFFRRASASALKWQWPIARQVAAFGHNIAFFVAKREKEDRSLHFEPYFFRYQSSDLYFGESIDAILEIKSEKGEDFFFFWF